MACVLFAACSSDDDVTPDVPNPDDPSAKVFTDVRYALYCTTDLLDYATPQVTYTNDEGRQVVQDIADSEWTDSDDFSYTATVNGKPIETKVKKWTLDIRYNRLPLDNSEMKVVYKPRANMPAYDRNKFILLFHKLFGSMTHCEDANRNFKANGTNSFTWNIHGTFTGFYDDLFSFRIDEMGKAYVSQVGYNESLIVGATNEEMVGFLAKHSDVQGVKVNSDGTYMSTYKEKEYVHTPYIDMLYVLRCSDHLLDMATPVVTYKDNDGKTVTLQLSKSDFVKDENLKWWGKHEHEPSGSIAEGAEPATIYKWTKLVSYDNFTDVTDEMSVQYLPKDTTEPLCLYHVFHKLSELLYWTNTKSEVKAIRTADFREVEGPTAKGEEATTVSFVAPDGTVSEKTGSVFTGSEGGINANGVYVSFKDYLIKNMSDYRSFRVKNDDTYIEFEK